VRPARMLMSVTTVAAVAVLLAPLPFASLPVPLLDQPAGAATPAVPDDGTGAAVGIHVSGGQLVEGDGSPPLLRGVSHAHTWYASRTGAFADIADAGANAEFGHNPPTATRTRTRSCRTPGRRESAGSPGPGAATAAASNTSTW
jgi:hypothetical protein